VNTTKKITQAFLLSGALSLYGHIAQAKHPETLTYNVSEQTYNDLKKVNQPFGYFKTTGKDPHMFVYLPGRNELQKVKCGIHGDGTEKDVIVHLEESPRDSLQLETLHPICWEYFFIDTNKRKKRRGRGDRDTVVGGFVEELLKSIRVLRDEKYSGTVLIDEYKANIPMIWTLKNLDHFKGIRAYFQNMCEVHGITPSNTQKPLLVLELEKEEELLDASDIEFLHKYFEVADPADKAIKEFFDVHKETFLDLVQIMGNAKKVSTKFGEDLLEAIEKPMGDFKFNNMALMTAKYAAIALLADYARQAILEKKVWPEKTMLNRICSWTGLTMFPKKNNRANCCIHCPAQS